MHPITSIQLVVRALRTTSALDSHGPLEVIRSFNCDKTAQETQVEEQR